MKITMMTFNLRTSRAQDGGNAWHLRSGQAAEMVRQHNPLFFGTQEAQPDMLDDLQSLTEYRWIGEGRMGDGQDEHCAIFFKKDELEVLEHNTFWLSEHPEVPGSISWDSSFPRICTWAHFRHSSTGTELLFFNTHLDHRGQQAREQGIRIICERISEQLAAKQLPVILSGDFNSTPDNPVIRLLRGELESQKAPVRMTDAYSVKDGPLGTSFHTDYCGCTEGEPIDYIFVTPDLQVSAVEIDRRMIDGRYPSDHYPVVAGLVLA
ncbi:endonuclease/exonuclease/phosphatase family protein [Paenibacillus thalictri]|uniref:Endonuclease/exonuclease/phosphatase family protein n=1 Tax=Paenibacillus thalictri TaxID=2527873 RepID=A0A4Q9DKM9_9BACL|nr:endonuclease/exonuclease/phosphatase family protein [Paenibacillus thalictri]TBL71401.1 endonuclease/exonuclease/phosphatase family protein [Paenibacillus thalictri]